VDELRVRHASKFEITQSKSTAACASYLAGVARKSDYFKSRATSPTKHPRCPVSVVNSVEGPVRLETIFLKPFALIHGRVSIMQTLGSNELGLILGRNPLAVRHA
jgi:hypothetical protein